MEKIYRNKLSGKTFDRPRYTVMVEDVLTSGDILIVAESDRLGRNKRDAMKHLQLFKNKVLYDINSEI